MVSDNKTYTLNDLSAFISKSVYFNKFDNQYIEAPSRENKIYIRNEKNNDYIIILIDKELIYIGYSKNDRITLNNDVYDEMLFILSIKNFGNDPISFLINDDKLNSNLMRFYYLIKKFLKKELYIYHRSKNNVACIEIEYDNSTKLMRYFKLNEVVINLK